MKSSKYIFISFVLLFFGVIFYSCQKFEKATFDHPTYGFVSWKPAPTWEETLLTGNGIIGAMVYGNPHDETIIVNHALLHMPVRTPLPPINQASRLSKIRQLLDEGKYEEAAMIPVEQSFIEGYEEKHWIDPFVPFCNIRINMQPGNIKDYSRMVDFETGEAKVQWWQDGNLYQRRVFSSRADSMLVMSIKGSEKINLSLALQQHPIAWDQREFVTGAIKNTEVGIEENYLTYRTEFVHKWEDNPEGFEGAAKVFAPGGNISSQNSEMIIENADEVLVLMSVKPNYNYENSLIPNIKLSLEDKQTDYKSLLNAQKKVHGELFNRIKLDLGGKNDDCLQSEAFVHQARTEGTNPSMIQKQFNAARYNIISSAGINPPTLQGIWSGTWTPPWSSGFTHDGNVETAIASLLIGNTPELMQAYLNYHERMMPYYRDNAKRMFNARGIIVPAHSSSHGWNIHFDEKWCLSFWTGGAGWTAGILYDYYLYTKDKELLKNRIYPFMKETAWFYEDFLFLGKDGKYVFSPSYSPENTPANKNSQAVIDATMDVMIAKEVLRNSIEAGKLIGEDEEQIKIWEEMLKRMPEYRINKDGELAEWLPGQMKENHNHRHVSHLYSLFLMIDPDFKENPELMDAALKVVEQRLEHRRNLKGGEMVFGLAQLGMVAANLQNKDLTAEIIELISRYFWAPQLATYHNPGNLFNMDVSGGFPKVVMRALAYSEPGMVRLLPALPDSWKNGSIKGMALRGNIEMEQLKWNESNIEVTFTASYDQSVKVELPEKYEEITASVDGSIVYESDNKDTFIIKLKANKPDNVKIVLN